MVVGAVLIWHCSCDLNRKLVGANDWFDAIEILLDKLYPPGRLELQIHRPMLLNLNNSSPERAPSFPLRKLATCDELGFVLRQERLLTADKRVRVSIVRNILTNSSYICKLYTKHKVFDKELSSLLSLNHPSILPPICKLTTLDSNGFIIDYLSSGQVAERYFQDLRSKDKSSSGQEVVARTVRDFAAAFLDAILFVHWAGFSHGDLKQPHILRLNTGQPVILDFEEAVSLQSDNFHRTFSRQLAPESALRHTPLQENIAIWAFGTLLASWNIRGSGDIVRVDGSKLSTVMDVPNYLSEDLRQVVFYCLQSNPMLRMFNTKEQISFLQSLPYWKGIDWGQMRAQWGHNGAQ